MNLGDLHSSVLSNTVQYAELSCKRQGLANDYVEVGLGDSTLSEIRIRTWGSAQQLHADFNIRPLNPPRLCV